jgi:hypothetical protein
MDETFRRQGVVGSETGAISPTIPAAAIEYLCTLEDPMPFSGQVVDGPAMVARLALDTGSP